MASDELKRNARSNLLLTLEPLADSERLRAYAAAVPFVHVPNELACQWEQHSSLLREQAWFRSAFTPSEIVALKSFDAQMRTFLRKLGRNLPDVEDLLTHTHWPAVSKAASMLLQILGRDPDNTARQ